MLLPPPGYITYDFNANITTDMGAMELILATDTLGDIYQNNTADDPDVAVEAYDTYVTIGATGPNPSSTQIFGGAVDLGGAATATFDTQNIDIAWVPASGIITGSGQRQIARVTLADTASGSWTVGGWQAGTNYDVPVMLTGAIVDGVILLSGDVNGDGFIDGTDLSIVIANWGKNGLGWAGGDLNDNGIVDGPDYAEVLSYWSLPSEPAGEPTPEPATLGLILLGGLALLRRARSA